MFKLERSWILVIAALLAVPAAAGFDRQQSFSGEELEIRNLIGEVRVEGHGGSDFEVDVRVDGDDASPERVRLETTDGRRSTLTVVFPVDESRRFVYPRMGRSSRTSFSSDDSGSWLSALFGRDRITVRGSGSGLEIWADVTVKVPHGKTLVVEHGVGDVEAKDVDGEVSLSIRSGPISAENIRGALTVDTGSGHVVVARVDGDVSVDTGSGHVNAEDCEGGRVHVDTGSGHVELDSIQTSELNVDTGSGRVTARAVTADSANIDTGSGGVTLYLDRMGTGDFRIDTGSGGIDLRIPEDASVDVRAETGSGGIDLDLGDVTLDHMERDEVAFHIGSGGARVNLDTGSGKIRITH